MSSILKLGPNAWEHRAGNSLTVIERDERGYFVPGFYGDGEPRFKVLANVRDWIEAVQGDPDHLPDDWRAYWASQAIALNWSQR